MHTLDEPYSDYYPSFPAAIRKSLSQRKFAEMMKGVFLLHYESPCFDEREIKRIGGNQQTNNKKTKSKQEKVVIGALMKKNALFLDSLGITPAALIKPAR